MIVTHNSALVPGLCDESLWLQDGRLVRQGPAVEVCLEYLAHFENEPAGAARSAPALEAFRP